MGASSSMRSSLMEEVASWMNLFDFGKNVGSFGDRKRHEELRSSIGAVAG